MTFRWKSGNDATKVHCVSTVIAFLLVIFPKSLSTAL